MTNEGAILLCSILLVMQITAAVFMVMTKREQKCYRSFIAFCFLLILWNLMQIFYFLSIDAEQAKRFYYLQMLAIPYLPVVGLIFILQLYDMEAYMDKRLVLIAFIMPVISSILSATNDYHFLFRTEFKVIQTEHMHAIYNVRGLWFNIHALYSYFFVSIGVLVSVIKGRNDSKTYKLHYYLITIGCLSGALFGVFTLTMVNETFVDTNFIGMTVGLLFFYFAIETKDANRHIIARNEIFESMSDIIFILNVEGKIIDLNKAAKQWLNDLDAPDVKNMEFEVLKSNLVDNGALLSENIDGGTETNIYFSEKNSAVFKSYNIKEQIIYAKGKEKIGTIVSFADITNMVTSLRNLMEISTIDPLTGLLNRRGYDRIMKEWDINGSYPVCVMIGDVNGLKYVNDSLGHIEGDKLLKSFSEILIEGSNNIGMAARIGGDEFALIFRDFDDERALEVIAKIRSKVKQEKEKLHCCSIALGYAMKTGPSQNMQEVIESADKNMYEDKENDRRIRERV